MIKITNLNKEFVLRGRRKVVADNINVTFPTGASVAILGRNGAGKSTLLSMISGAIEPDTGSIYSDGTISWPVGFSGSFHRELSGCQNVRFIARVYGVDSNALVEFVKEFAQLGKHFYLPVRTYSSGMRSRLAFGASMGVQFDTYLVDEVTAVGDADFRIRSRILFKDRIRNSGALLVTHSMQKVRNMCDSAAILEDGKLTYYTDLEYAISRHLETVGGDPDDDEDEEEG
ncbi:ABC transporter ATP-binding protein [Planktotalea sp.]|uniref:ABC transporter ATP-binding protein n=1 Tax=Planktotalea sp. TaxID=2029877 RepID=UPI003D6B0BB4